VKSFRPLARQIRAAARARLRSSRPLWKEYKRLRKGWWSKSRSRVASLAFLYLLLPTLIFIRGHNQPVPATLLVLYCTATSIWRAGALNGVLYRSGDLAYFMHTPATDREFFGFAWRRAFRSTLLVSLASLLAFGYLVVVRDLGVVSWLAAAVAATLQWVSVLSLVVILTQLRLPSWLRSVSVGMYILLFVAFFLPPQLISSVQPMLLPLPTSWVPFMFERAVLGRDSRFLYLLFPVLLLIGLLPMAFRRLRDGYPAAELVYPLQTIAGQTGEEQETETENRDDVDWRPQDTPQVSRVDVSHSLRPFDWKSSRWLERLVNRTFNARDRAVAEFLCGGVAAPWSGLWFLACKFAAVGLLTLPWLVDPRIGGAIGAIACMIALPVLGGKWLGLQTVRYSTTLQPAFAALPISYWDVTSVVAKVNLIRYLVWLPVFLSYGALLGWKSFSSPIRGLEIALGIFFVLLWSQPLAIVGLHSSGTNDTKRITLHSVAGAGVILLLAITYATSVFLIASGLRGIARPVFLAAIIAILICPTLIWFTYKRWYERGKIDTVRIAD